MKRFSFVLSLGLFGLVGCDLAVDDKSPDLQSDSSGYDLVDAEQAESPDPCKLIASCVDVTYRGISWSDPDECADAVNNPEACVEAWAEIPCPGPKATIDDIIAIDRQVKAALEACMSESSE